MTHTMAMNTADLKGTASRTDGAMTDHDSTAAGMGTLTGNRKLRNIATVTMTW